MRNKTSKKELLSLPQAARVMGLSRIEIYRRVKRGDLPAQRIGRNYFIQRQDLGEIYSPLTKKAEKQVDQAIKKTLRDYSETLRLLGKE